MKVASYRRIW